MKIRYVTDKGCPVGAFVVDAENDTDNTILSQFIDYLEKDGRRLGIQSSTYQNSHTTSFRFGVIEEPHGNA